MMLFGKRNKEPKTPDGRKYRLAIICLFVLLGGYVISGLNPVFAALFTELAGGTLGTLAIYCGGNVANKWTIGKTGGFSVGVQQQQLPNGGEVLDANVNERGDLGRE